MALGSDGIDGERAKVTILGDGSLRMEQIYV